MPSAIRHQLKKLFSFSWPKMALLLITIISSWHIFSVRLAGDASKNVILSDGAGYYAYLPATFIYHDYSFQFAEEGSKTYRCGPGCDIHYFGNRTRDGKRINKYFIGTSILEMPFFFAGIILSATFGYSVDGYSFPFQLCICLAALFYLFVGMICLIKILQHLKFNEFIISIIPLLLFFGTNLYHYTLEEPSMSHVFSFAVISFFLHIAFSISENYSSRKLLFFIASFVLIILIRPSNGIIIFILPFVFSFATDKKKIIGSIVAERKTIIVGIIFAVLLFSLQFITWKIESGHWIADSYKGESLNLLHPKLISVLFSWEKGLFIYAPLLLFSCAGLFFLPFKNSLPVLLFLFVNAWIISCWHDWTYGGSLGMRPFIDTYVLFAILLAFFIRGIKNKVLIVTTSLVFAFFVFLNLFQHYQYHVAILPYQYMSFDKYKRIFLQSDEIFSGIYDPVYEGKRSIPKGSTLLTYFTRNFDNDTFSNNKAGIITGEQYYSAPAAVKLSARCKCSATLPVPLAANIPENVRKRTWIQVHAKIWLGEPLTDAKMVIAFMDKDSTLNWNGFYLVHQVDETFAWHDFNIAIPVPENITPTEFVSVYVLKTDFALLYVDDFDVSLWSVPTKYFQ